MKTVLITLSSSNSVLFYIGTNANDNDQVILNGSPDDFWFHAAETSSCHVVAMMPDKYNKKEKHQIIKAGAALCKQHTTKLKKEKTTPFIFTKLRHVQRTSTAGLVKTNLGSLVYV
jgi:predicted ribosome quality control (RQC) complex YloA/Tae2 family protein